MNNLQDLFEDINAIIRKTEKQVKKIKKDTSLSNPIENDIIVAKRNMAYNEIKSQIIKYKEMEE